MAARALRSGSRTHALPGANKFGALWLLTIWLNQLRIRQTRRWLCGRQKQDRRTIAELCPAGCRRVRRGTRAARQVRSRHRATLPDVRDSVRHRSALVDGLSVSVRLHDPGRSRGSPRPRDSDPPDSAPSTYHSLPSPSSFLSIVTILTLVSAHSLPSHRLLQVSVPPSLSLRPASITAHCLHSFGRTIPLSNIAMFLDRFAFLHPLMARARRQPAPPTKYVDDNEHEMSTLGAKPAPRPPLRARLFSAASSMSARSARSAKSAKSARSGRSNRRGQGEREEKQSLLGRRRSGGKCRTSQPPATLKPAPTAIPISKKASGQLAKLKRRRIGRSPKIPPQPTTLQLSRGPERESLDAQAAALHRKIATQRRRLAADLEDCGKPFPR